MVCYMHAYNISCPVCGGDPIAGLHEHFEEPKQDEHPAAHSQPTSAQEPVEQMRQDEDPNKHETVVEPVIEVEIEEVEPPPKKQKVGETEEIQEVKGSKEDEDAKGEPPLVLRVEQWAQKPAASPKRKGRAKAKTAPKAKAKGGRKPKGTTDEKPVEVLSDNESEKRKMSTKGGKKAPPKRNAKANKIEKTEEEGATESTEKEKDRPIKYKRVDEEGKRDITQAFQWDKPNGNDGIDPPDLPLEPPAQPPAEPPAEPPADGTGKLKSFARRPKPKNSPSSEKWLAIRDTFHGHVSEWVQFYQLPVYCFEASFHIKEIFNIS